MSNKKRELWQIKPHVNPWWIRLVYECFDEAVKAERLRLKKEIEKMKIIRFTTSKYDDEVHPLIRRNDVLRLLLDYTSQKEEVKR